VLLSAGSLAFTSGVLMGMYLRGVAFGYNVVWQSTLVQTPAAALDWLEVLFLPARWLAPGSFPDLASVAQLATPDGTPAGPWIHCFAVTALVYALLPRLALLVWQQWGVQRAGACAQLDLAEPYFEQLFRGGRPASADFDRVALEGFALDANQYAVLASLQAGLIETDLRLRTRRFFAWRDTLPKRNRWYPEWKRVVEGGWRDAFPEQDRPRFQKLDSAEFRAALARALDEIAAIETAIAAKRAELEELARAEREAGGDVTSMALRASEVETNLYSGTVSAAKELEALQEELQTRQGGGGATSPVEMS